MQIDTRGMSQEELIQSYFGIYFFRLKMGMITISEAEGYISVLEGTEEFEGCAGIKKAIERHIEEGLSNNSDL